MNESQNPLILVIDDENQIIEEVVEVLNKAGYQGHGCSTTKEAFEFASTARPDLIISDINLGGESGLKTCETLKNDYGFDDVPVMFLSGAQIPDIIRRSHEAGGTYYLRKPFDPQVLLELVDKALWMPHLVHAHQQEEAATTS
jgi:CheY-like chemotaxis protein